MAAMVPTLDGCHARPCGDFDFAAQPTDGLGVRNSHAEPEDFVKAEDFVIPEDFVMPEDFAAAANSIEFSAEGTPACRQRIAATVYRVERRRGRL